MLATLPCCPSFWTRSRRSGDRSVTADGAFDTRKCHEAIAVRGAAAIIPPRKNAKPWKPDTPGAIARNEALCEHQNASAGRSGDDGAAITAEAGVENQDALCETAGQRLAARDFDRQVAEFQVRVAVLNRFTALGIPLTETVG